MCNIENSQKVNQNFKVDGVKYQFDVKHVDNLSLHDTSVNSKHHDPPLVQTRPNRGTAITGAGHTFIKNIAKCKSQHHYDKTPYHLDEHGIAKRKVQDGLNIFHTILVPPKITTLHSVLKP